MIRGLRFLHILAPCPSGWKYEPDLTIRLARLAVETCVFPLVEIDASARPKVTYAPPRPRPVAEYLKLQGRFGHLDSETMAAIPRAGTGRSSSLGDGASGDAPVLLQPLCRQQPDQHVQDDER